MNIQNTINILKEKYGYDDKLLSILKPIIVNMIKYYGSENENKIIEAFINTPIGFIKNDEDLEKFSNNIGLKETIKFPVIASGGYDEVFQKDDNGNIKRIPYIVIRDKDLQDEKSVVDYYDTIVHECCHMVMNYGKCEIVDNTVVSKIGLLERKIEFDNNIGINKDSNVNIEEGLNEYDARQIVEMMLGKKIDVSTYRLYVSYVTSIMHDEKIRKIIDNSRLNGDDNWKQVLGSDLSDEFIESLENFADALFKHSKDKELKDKAYETMNETYKKVSSYVDNYELNSMFNEEENNNEYYMGVVK